MTTEVELLQHGRSAASTLPQPCRIRPAGRSAQRHQGGARRAEDSRGAECPASLILRYSTLEIFCSVLNRSHDIEGSTPAR